MRRVKVEFYDRSETISIHAPAKGATFEGKEAAELIQDFNPRTREGCDKIADAIGREIEISIHAPAKGATYIYD